jgi:predicted metal-dependent phosphotriesterase family hydrolase
MMRMFISSLLARGISAEEIDLMARKNPCALLNA